MQEQDANFRNKLSFFFLFFTFYHLKFRKEKKKKETCNITRLWTRYFPCMSINDKIYGDWNEKLYL